MNGSTLQDYATEAIRYWEPRRLFYNLLLVAVVAITFWLNLPSSRAAMTIDSVLWLLLLAVVANITYCAAYVVDLFVQASAFAAIGGNSDGYCLHWEVLLLRF